MLRVLFIRFGALSASAAGAWLLRLARGPFFGLPNTTRTDPTGHRGTIQADALAEGCTDRGVTLNLIPPGKLQKYGYVERFIRSFRENILDCYLFESLDEVREMAWQWQIEYQRTAAA